MADTKLPKISVVVTCYNCRDYIGDAIRSVARQTLRDFECVVVDDASTDDSSAVVRQLLDELADPRFLLIRLDKNVGQTGATRRGLAATRATFVCFLDSDDLWNDDFLERHLAAHLNETYAVGFTACNARLIDGQGALIAGCVYWFGKDRARVDHDQAFAPVDPARVPRLDAANGTAREIDEGQRQHSNGEARSSGIDLAGIDTIGGRVEDPVVSRGRVDLENATGMPAGKPEDANRRWKGPLASGHDRYIMTASGKRGDESRSHESPSASHERLHDLPPSGRCWKQDKANPQVAMPPPSDPPPRNVRHRRALRVWLAHKTE